MSVREDFVEAVKEGFEERDGAQETRPNVEVWPEEDEFGDGFASHTDRVRTVVMWNA